MKKYIIYILIFPLILSCSLISNKLKIVEIRFNAEYFLLKQKAMQKMSNLTKIAYNGDHQMFIFLKRHLQTKDILDDKGEVIDKITTKIDTSFIYYVIKNGSKEGLVYGRDREDKLKPLVFNLDSMLIHSGMNSDNYKILGSELGSPIIVVKQNSKQWTEKYAVQKTASKNPDSIYRSYNSELKDIEFTFSNDLDKKKNSKLVKVQMIYNAEPKELSKRDYDIPKNEVQWEIKLSQGDDKAKLMSYFDRFKKDQQQFKLK